MNRLFKALDDFPQFKILLDSFDTIICEYNNFIQNNSFITKNNNFIRPHKKTVEWIKQQKNNEDYYKKGGNANNWIVIPLYKDKFCFKNEFVKTNNILKKIKNLNFSGFFCLKSNQSIPYHKHSTKTAIIHINMFTLFDGKAFTYLDESNNGDPNTFEDYCSYYEKKGMKDVKDYVIFNPFLYHYAENKSITDRITFGVEVNV
jgi:hypothetical protein